MTAGPIIDPAQLLHEQLAQASPDLMRELLQTFINSLLSAQADSVCSAEYGLRTAERTNRCNGYRHRDLDTRVGTLDVAIPKLREGSYFPDWLLERRKRAEAALTTVVTTCYAELPQRHPPLGWSSEPPVRRWRWAHKRCPPPFDGSAAHAASAASISSRIAAARFLFIRYFREA